jgi:hypothetical protein
MQRLGYYPHFEKNKFKTIASSVTNNYNGVGLVHEKIAHMMKRASRK